MSLDSILKEMKELKQFADEDPDSGPPETMVGRRGRKQQAIVRLADLKINYAIELQQSVVFILTAGSKKEEFEQVAVSEAIGFFSADPETFYTDLANRIHPSLYTKNASPSNLFDILGRHLEDKMLELLGPTGSYNQLIFKEKYIKSVSTAQEFSQVIKTAINEQIGSEIVGVQALNSILDKAIQKGHKGLTTPIVIPVSDEKFAIQLAGDLRRITQRVFLVNAGKVGKELRAISNAINLKEVTEETVKDTVDQIVKSLKR